MAHDPAQQYSNVTKLERATHIFLLQLLLKIPKKTKLFSLQYILIYGFTVDFCIAIAIAFAIASFAREQLVTIVVCA